MGLSSRLGLNCLLSCVNLCGVVLRRSELVCSVCEFVISLTEFISIGIDCVCVLENYV